DDGSTDNTRKVVQNYIYRLQTSDLRLKTKDKKEERIDKQQPSNLRPQTKDIKQETRNKKTEKQNKILNPKIKYIYQSHKGVSKARNLGIASSKGEFICFLDSDDRFRTGKLQITYNYIKRFPKHSIFHTEEIWYKKGKIISQKIYHKKPDRLILNKSVKLCCIGMSTSAIKKDAFNKIGLFDEAMPACEDYDFWIRASLKFSFILIPEPFTMKEGGHPDQQSKKYPAMDKLRIYSLQKILNQKKLTPENYTIIYKELINKCNIYIKGAIKRNKTDEVDYYRKIIKEFDK
ncbi:MAG: glycosyltransferase, partial [Candidatus Omnitrophica bacterium]|nr:glycosyltransferase [Candidatus Omnitrophota bacterium]